MKEIRKTTKIIVAAIIAFVAIFSVVIWSTMPLVPSAAESFQMNTLYEHGISTTNKSTKVNLSSIGQTESVSIFFNTAVAPWPANDVIAEQLNVVKTGQELTAPFTAASVSISNIQIHANGTKLFLKASQPSMQTYNGTQFISYFGTIGSIPTSNSINLTVTFAVQIILISGIYHFPGEKKTHNCQC